MSSNNNQPDTCQRACSYRETTIRRLNRVGMCLSNPAFCYSCGVGPFCLDCMMACHVGHKTKQFDIAEPFYCKCGEIKSRL